MAPWLSEKYLLEIYYMKYNIWELAFGVLVDQDEACIVKENAALILANLTNHTSRNVNDKTSLILGVDPSKTNKDIGVANSLWELIEEYRLYSNIESMITCLYTMNGRTLVSNGKNGFGKYTYSEKSWSSSSSSSKIAMISTPALIKTITIFLLRLFTLDADGVTYQLQERGLIKLLFRCLTNPNIAVNNTKELALYCEILEMNTLICCFLGQAVSKNNICLGTVLHTRDCLNVMMSLLNPDIYCKCYTEIFYTGIKFFANAGENIETICDSLKPTRSGKK